jgi:hypothetical protein
VVLEETCQVLIIYSAFIIYLTKMGTQETVYQFFIYFKKAYNSVMKVVLYDILTDSLYRETGNANKNVSK